MTTPRNKDTFVETFSGKRIDFLNPQVDQILLEDIAYGLARASRYVGQTRTQHPLPIAQHSVWIADKIYQITKNPIKALMGLHHDDPEFATNDIPGPLKVIISEHTDILDRIEDRLHEVICQALGLPFYQEPYVKMLDKIALAVEADKFMFSRGKDWLYTKHVQFSREDSESYFTPVPWTLAENLFLSTHKRYMELR